MENSKEKSFKAFGGISSFGLHIIAMGLMLCDHLWASVLSTQGWLTWIGRLAYPIFAFLIVEGYFYTSDFMKYLKRIFFFAVISEVPFNLLYNGTVIYPFHQNVLWTFAVSLLCMRWIDYVRRKRSFVTAVLMSAGILLLGYLAALLFMMDYYGYGVLTVLIFYIFRGDKWWQRTGQLAGLIYINVFAIKGLRVPITMSGTTIEIAQQSLAVLAIIPIWMYRGRQGLHNRLIQFAFYAFYPVHLLILGLL